MANALNKNHAISSAYQHTLFPNRSVITMSDCPRYILAHEIDREIYRGRAANRALF